MSSIIFKAWDRFLQNKTPDLREQAEGFDALGLGCRIQVRVICIQPREDTDVLTTLIACSFPIAIGVCDVGCGRRRIGLIVRHRGIHIFHNRSADCPTFVPPRVNSVVSARMLKL